MMGAVIRHSAAISIQAAGTCAEQTQKLEMVNCSELSKWRALHRRGVWRRATAPEEDSWKAWCAFFAIFLNSPLKNHGNGAVQSEKPADREEEQEENNSCS